MTQAAGKKTLTERVRREKEEILSAPPTVDIERLKFLLDVYRETEMEPVVMRRAKLFHKLCAEKEIYIDGNPLAGTLTRYKYGAYPFPEEGCRWMKRVKEIDLPRGRAPITPEVREWIDKAVEYWGDANVYNAAREVVLQSRNVDVGVLSKCGVGLEIVAAAVMLVSPDYSKVLNRGLKGIMAEVLEAESKLDIGAPGGLAKWYFYKAVKLCLDGMMVLSERYASLAREIARNETSLERKLELELIAETCEWVPANPARNFPEALQSVWFTMLGNWLECPVELRSPPANFPKYMYPFYKKDKAENRITDEQGIELIQFFFLRMNQLACVLAPHGYAWQQSRLGLQLSLGGLTPDGEDATNELDWLVLEAQNRILLPEPLVNLVYHDKLSEAFLLKCVDLIKTGIGQPAFHNSRVGIERHLYHHKMPLEEARVFAIDGCVQSHVPGCTDGAWYARFNVAKVVELALNDGKDALTGLQLGPRTGNAESFQTYDDFHGAFDKQLAYFVPLMHGISRTTWTVNRERLPLPFGSSLVNDCIREGKDIVDGGARYSWGDGVCFVGVIDAANSLAAVKKLVYEERQTTMKRLTEALAADFKGYEEIERMCLGAPKYGNDDKYADSIARDIYTTCWDLHPKTDHLGRPIMPSAYSVVAHYGVGRFTGALPSGHRAGKPLTDATVSAQPGTDTSGPTALAKSAAAVLDGVKYGSTHLNMKFHPLALKGAEGARKLLRLIKTYFDLGGYHVQFNCVSSDTLKQAQLQPEEYRDLIVRVAGFSAFFVHLDKEVQNEIIKRTDLAF